MAGVISRETGAVRQMPVFDEGAAARIAEAIARAMVGLGNGMIQEAVREYLEGGGEHE